MLDVRSPSRFSHHVVPVMAMLLVAVLFAAYVITVCLLLLVGASLVADDKPLAGVAVLALGASVAVFYASALSQLSAWATAY